MSPIKDRLYEMQQLQNGNDDIELTIPDESEKINRTLAKIELIREQINFIENNTKRANEILKISVFKVSKELQQELDTLFSNNTTTAYKINSYLKECEDELNKINDISSVEFRIKKLQYATVKQEFKDVLNESSSCLEFHKNNKAELLKKSLKTVRKDITNEEVEALLEENKFDIFTDNLLITTEDAKRQLADIQDRHQELLKIEKHLAEVLDLFIKLATLVDEQQELVDRVEFHTEIAADFIETGTKEIEKTIEKKKKYSRKKMFLIFILVIILLIVILIFVL